MSDDLSWKRFCDFKEQLIIEGAQNGLVKPYDEELIETLRNVFYGGIPASIILLCRDLCNGYCYDRATLLTRGLSLDYKLVKANINTLRLNPKFIKMRKTMPDYAAHRFVEVSDENNIIWVYDTTSGFVMEKSLFYRIEQPEILKVDSKHAVDKFCNDLELVSNEGSPFAIELILPFIEKIANNELMYQDLLLREIELFKISMSGLTTKPKL